MTLFKTTRKAALRVDAEGRLMRNKALKELAHSGRIDLTKRANLVGLREGLEVRRLDASGCENLARLPAGLRVRHLKLEGCTALTELPLGLHCYELDLGGTSVHTLPADLRVDYRLDLHDCRRLETLPESLKVGTLVLRGCTALSALPEGLDVRFLDLRGCENLTTWADGSNVRIGRLDIGGCRRLAMLPENLGPLAQLNVADCTALNELPEGLKVHLWVDVAHSGLKRLPVSMEGVRVRWRGVPIDERIAFRPETITLDEVLGEPNAELRRVLLERYGVERFLLDVDAEVLDEDQDAGGTRRLLRVRLQGDEDLVAVMVYCPSTGGRYLLRVPPAMKSCHQAVAWTAGFADPSQYQPIVEA
jgi:hypothetical protein